MTKRMKVYKAKDGWRWRLWSSSDIVAESGEAYATKGYTVMMAERLHPDATLEVEDGKGHWSVIAEGDAK